MLSGLQRRSGGWYGAHHVHIPGTKHDVIICAKSLSSVYTLLFPVAKMSQLKSAAEESLGCSVPC